MKGVPAAALAAALLAGCAAPAPPPATVVSEAAFAAAIVPEQTTAPQLQALLGPTRVLAFDSGYQAWLYVAPAGREHYTELVVLIGPDGRVRKVRVRR